jgi:trehalose 2-sulfotransferase
LFPRCKHVFMTRRDKVRLAVSWWRAIQTKEWHRPRQAAPTIDGPPPRYDAGAIEHLLIEANLREADMQDQFDRWGVVPHTVVYEDLIARFEPTVRALLDFLDVPGRAGIPIPAPAFLRLADALSDEWCERYRRERGPT